MSAQRPPIEEMTLRQLRRVASELNISRYSRMRKDQLLNSILEIQQLRTVLDTTRVLEAQGTEAVQPDVDKTERTYASFTNASFTDVDETLPDLPNGYGESCIVLMPRDPQWAYAYWDVSNASKDRLRQQGGVRLALRFYDITNVDIETQRPHSMQQYECDELAREWYLPVPVSDRDYMIEIGYVTLEGRWLMLARSESVRIAPVYPSDWIDDQFVTIDWDEDLRSKTFLRLAHPTRQLAVSSVSMPVYQEAFALAEKAESKRSTGSVFGSIQQAPEESISSYVFPSGIGNWASGVGSFSESENMSGVGRSSGVGASGMSGVDMTLGIGTMSGISAVGMSGIGTISGIGTMRTSGIGMISGVGMISGIGMMEILNLSTMSGIGMSGAGAVGMSGIGTSGIGTMSGIGMSGTGAAGMSGIGMSGISTMSGIGMSSIGMSGIGMSGTGASGMSGIGMSGISTMSGIGMISGIGFLGTGMSGTGMYTTSGTGMSGVGMSGVGMSGIGMSGIGFSASLPPTRPRQFWMMGDAELIIHGATEVDANVTIAGQPIKLNPDGTFRVQLSFQDGEIDFPIMAVAADGEQTRTIHLKFNRETFERRTNSPEESVQEWLS